MAITRNPTNFNKFQFLNRETQFETGYIDLIHRQFDPQTGRFTSQDPVIEGQEHLSLYQYSWNNPILKSDPDGDCPFCPAIPLLPEIGAGVIALGEYIAGSTLGLAVGAGLTKLANSGVLAGGGNSIVPYYAQMKAKQAEKELAVNSVSSSNESKSSSKGDNGKNGGSFDAGKDTKSTTQKEAFNKAKEQNGIPKSQQPKQQYKTPDKNTGKPLRTYEYRNSKGEKVIIRKDNPVTYPDGGKQGEHYNAGKVKDNTEKLKQHHNYEND